MMCERVREQIPECLAGKLDPATRDRVIDHLEKCSACRAEVAELGVVWRGLDSMQDPEPSAAMRTRFLETLHAYEEGFQEAQRRQVYVEPRKSFWAGWWPAHPAWQAVFSAILVLAGAFGGRYALEPHPGGQTQEMAQLKGQVENLRQLVALSLLQEQSPSARLRGVNYSYQMAQPDRQVEQALLYAVNHDSNVNVRLSAVDALSKFTGNHDIRRALADSLSIQESPLVQVALLDLIAQIKDKDAAPAVKKLMEEPATDPDVRQRANAALEKLGGTQ
jgi:hypothetical protein